MATANEILNSRLFKTVAPKIKSISNERLLYELCQIDAEKAALDLTTVYLDCAFIWRNTPQKQAYWSDLGREAGG